MNEHLVITVFTIWQERIVNVKMMLNDIKITQWREKIIILEKEKNLQKAYDIFLLSYDKL